MKNCEPLVPGPELAIDKIPGTSCLRGGVEFVLELVAWAAGARTLGTAALDHEVFDHTMERQPIIKAFAGELLEVGDRLWGLVVEQFDADHTFIGGHRGNFSWQLSFSVYLYFMQVSETTKIAAKRRFCKPPGMNVQGPSPNDQ